MKQIEDDDNHCLEKIGKNLFAKLTGAEFNRSLRILPCDPPLFSTLYFSPFAFQ